MLNLFKIFEGLPNYYHEQNYILIRGGFFYKFM